MCGKEKTLSLLSLRPSQECPESTESLYQNPGDQSPTDTESEPSRRLAKKGSPPARPMKRQYLTVKCKRHHGGQVNRGPRATPLLAAHRRKTDFFFWFYRISFGDISKICLFLHLCGGCECAYTHGMHVYTSEDN